MDNRRKEIFGVTIQAIGTVIAAVGSTPFPSLTTEQLNGLSLIGNVLQGTGNVLQADGQGQPSLEKTGNEIQAIGNSIVVAGLVIPFEEDADERLVITGNWLQALGGLVALADEFNDRTAAGQSFNITGNLLQAIGNSLQAVSGIMDIQEGRAERIVQKEDGNIEENEDAAAEGREVRVWDVTGSWIQAVGSVLNVIGQIREEQQEQRKGQNNKTDAQDRPEDGEEEAEPEGSNSAYPAIINEERYGTLRELW